MDSFAGKIPRANLSHSLCTIRTTLYNTYIQGPEECAGGFPPQLTPSGVKSLPIPAVGFFETAPSLKKIFNNSLKIYITHDQRDLSKNQTNPPYSAKESKS